MESVSSRVTHTDLVCGDTANKPENEAAAEELTVSQNRRLSGYTTATHTHTHLLFESISSNFIILLCLPRVCLTLCACPLAPVDVSLLSGFVLFITTNFFLSLSSQH